MGDRQVQVGGLGRLFEQGAIALDPFLVPAETHQGGGVGDAVGPIPRFHGEQAVELRDRLRVLVPAQDVSA